MRRLQDFFRRAASVSNGRSVFGRMTSPAAASVFELRSVSVPAARSNFPLKALRESFVLKNSLRGAKRLLSFGRPIAAANVQSLPRQPGSLGCGEESFEITFFCRSRRTGPAIDESMCNRGTTGVRRIISSTTTLASAQMVFMAAVSSR